MQEYVLSVKKLVGMARALTGQIISIVFYIDLQPITTTLVISYPEFLTRKHVLLIKKGYLKAF